MRIRGMTGAALVAVALTVSLAPAGTAATATSFLVPTAPGTSGFGAFKQFVGHTSDAAAMRKAFGRPSSARRAPQQTCILRWGSLGISARVFRVGDPPPCKHGSLRQARLTDARWHTPGSIHPGSMAAQASAQSLRSCSLASCGVNGYALELHRRDCASGRVPGVIAEVEGATVTALIVRSRGCE
jgi:hypothetical protein